MAVTLIPWLSGFTKSANMPTHTHARTHARTHAHKHTNTRTHALTLSHTHLICEYRHQCVSDRLVHLAFQLFSSPPTPPHPPDPAPAPFSLSPSLSCYLRLASAPRFRPRSLTSVVLPPSLPPLSLPSSLALSPAIHRPFHRPTHLLAPDWVWIGEGDGDGDGEGVLSPWLRLSRDLTHRKHPLDLIAIIMMMMMMMITLIIYWQLRIQSWKKTGDTDQAVLAKINFFSF